MSSTNKTTYYDLPQFVDSDLFNPLMDDNDAYDKIDTALHNIADAEANDASEIVGVKGRVTTAEGKIEALATTAQTLSGAVTELDGDVSSLDGRLDIVEDDINNVNTGLKVKVTALETQNGNDILGTTAQTLSGAINEIDLSTCKFFDTVADMIQSNILKKGITCKTNGYYSTNDGGGAFYVIEDTGTENDMDVIKCGNLYAHLIITSTMFVEQFGAKGDGVSDDTDIIEYFLNKTGIARYVVAKKYAVTDTIAITNSNCVIDFGEIIPTSYATQHDLFKLVSCEHVEINNLNVSANNDKNAYVIPGFTDVVGAKSSNLVGLRILRCKYLVINNYVSTNLLVGGWLGALNNDFTTNGNTHIIFNNLVMLYAHQGFQLQESDELEINGFIFHGPEIIQNGYHVIYSELNTRKTVINNVDILFYSRASVFDMADKHGSDTLHDDSDGTWYSQSFYVNGGKIIFGATAFQFRKQNNIAHFENLIIEQQAIDHLYPDTRGYYIYSDETDKTNSANVEFVNCTFKSTAPDIPNLAITSYLDMNFIGCDMAFVVSNNNSIINTYLGRAKFMNCKINNAFLFLDDGYVFTDGSRLEFFGCAFNITSDQNAMYSKTTSMLLNMCNCYTQFSNSELFNNNNTRGNISISLCEFRTSNMSNYVIADTSPIGLAIAGSYKNTALISSYPA